MDNVALNDIGVDALFTMNAKSEDEFARGNHEGYPVKITDNLEVGHCSANDLFDGIVEAISADGKLITVVKRGWKEVIYSGEPPSAGKVNLSADGDGGVKEDDENGEEFLVGNVDTTNIKLTIWLG